MGHQEASQASILQPTSFNIALAPDSPRHAPFAAALSRQPGAGVGRVETDLPAFRERLRHPHSARKGRPLAPSDVLGRGLHLQRAQLPRRMQALRVPQMPAFGAFRTTGRERWDLWTG